jgi:ATP-dependent Clp protease ATP-binding subunit ClpA
MYRIAIGLLPMRVRWAARNMFERFTDRARRAMVLAQEQARMLNYDYIGTEHILLGLIRESKGVAAQVLVKLGADLNRVRQQVIQLLHGHHSTDVIGEGSQRGKQARARLLDDALARIDDLDRRLAAIERWAGLRPDLDDLVQEIAQVRREKEAAIDQQDFEAAAVLRDKETQLLAARAAREKEWTQTAAGRPPLAGELGRVNARRVP